ncbi:MAG: DUF2179 domain-containing protein [Anaerolineales bacterium]|jgi:uncharacterized protein YebE (UPF0316 family)
MIQLLTSAGIIFFLRMTDITFATMRVFMVVRGKKVLAWFFGFLQALIYVLVISAILADLENWTKILGYAFGFATGLVVGMTIEKRLALGYTNLQIVCPQRGLEVASALRDEGYAVTEVAAQGKDGAVEILHCSVLRKEEAKLFSSLLDIDPSAFITAKNVYRVQHGFWH